MKTIAKVYRVADPTKEIKPYVTGFKRDWPDSEWDDEKNEFVFTGKEKSCHGPEDFRREICPEDLDFEDDGKYPCHDCPRYKFYTTWGARGKLFLSRGAAMLAQRRAIDNGAPGAMIEALSVVREVTP